MPPATGNRSRADSGGVAGIPAKVANNPEEGWSVQDLQDAAAWIEGEQNLSYASRSLEVQEELKLAMEECCLRGTIETFGSHRSGFRTGGSDVDVVYLPDEGVQRMIQEGETSATAILQMFAVSLLERGYYNMVSVFHATLPLLKVVAPNGADVDLCVGNELGLRNSQLMHTYGKLDERVTQLGQNIKNFAKHFDIGCSVDGHLNSYAYTLMSIYYLMCTNPVVIPNLQNLSAQVDNAPMIVKDQRWGCQDEWDCQYFENVDLIPKNRNKMDLGELTHGFFNFYVNVFDWQRHAVSVRLATTSQVTGGHPLKEGLKSTQGSNVWYIEDPFDLKHNLAALSTSTARARIMDCMQRVLAALNAAPQAHLLKAFYEECPQDGEHVRSMGYWLKSRVQPEKVSKEKFMEAFQFYPIEVLYWPKQPATSNGVRVEAFLKFAKEKDRRATHIFNERYVGNWQVRLLSCSAHAMEDASRETGAEFEKIEGFSERAQQEPSSQADLAEQIRTGLLAAERPEEVNVLLQRAKAMGLQDEVRLAESMLGSKGKLDSEGGGRWRARDRRTSSMQHEAKDKAKREAEGAKPKASGATLFQ